MSASAAQSFGGSKLTMVNYPSWQVAFMNYLASLPDGTALLNCLEELLDEQASVAAQMRDRKVLGLMRNACTDPIRIHL